MRPLVFLDIETTGMDPNTDRIIEIALVKWQDSKILERYESLVDPGVPIPYVITSLTGIRDEDVRSAPKFSEIKNNVLNFIGDLPVVGHNIGFDTGFLKSHHVELRGAQIDTVALARILLLKEHSYALQVLMKKYGLPVRESHRAMADTETAIEFFKFLLKKIEEIPAELFAQISAVLKKSEWSGKEVFGAHRPYYPKRNDESFATQNQPSALDTSLSATTSRRSFCASATTAASQNSIKEISAPPATFLRKKVAGGAHTWPQPIIQNFLGGQKILLESLADIPFAELKRQKLLIAYSILRKRNELVTEAKSAGLSVAQLKEPQFYLSPKKLSQRLAQEKIKASETPLLLKMILWNAQTVSGDREEITLEREEYGMFDLIADTEGEDIFWGEALERAAGCDVVLVHQYGFARRIGEKLPDAASRALIIVEASKLEDSFTYAHGNRLAQSDLQPIFGDKTTMLFGMLGIFDRFMEMDLSGYRGNVIMSNETRASVEWRRVLDTVKNLPEHPKKKEIAQILAPQENTVQWVQSFQEEVSFHSAPVALGDFFQTAIKSFKKILLQSPALSANGTFKLVRELFELDSTWKTIAGDRQEIARNLNIKILGDLPDPFSEKFFKACVKLFLKIIEERGGRVLIILNSKKTVMAMYSELLPKIPAGKINLLAVGPSGGSGKSLALFLEDPSRSILLATNQILPFLGEIEDHIETVVFQKIPFDPPSDPLIAIRSRQFDNGFEEYSLPRAVMKFREILAELGRSGRENKSAADLSSASAPRTEVVRGAPKTCYLLDNRLQTRDYGRMFI